MFIPRKGQADLIKALPSIRAGDCKTIQWPTGYGKSIGFAIAWKHCHDVDIANRFLLIVANDTQRQQIKNDFASDCHVVGAPCSGGIWPFERAAIDLRYAKDKEVEVFVCTVQQLEASNRGGVNTLKDLLTTPGTKWMLGFDEFHHYGIEMPWGEAARAAMQYATFTLAMSATPYRRGADVIFPEPEFVMTYMEGVEEEAVKPMICHSYDYKVTVIQGEDEISTYTTSELFDEAPDGIDRWEERCNIRYSPEYIHPLISNPLTRLMQKRVETGVRLQMLIRAMSCLHARMVCDQVKTFAGTEFKADWIGTGPHGRDDRTNDAIRSAFCPKKINGKRPEPEIDILVQVSMAGEGFDSINVAEIVDVFPVSKRALSGRATADKQFYGRGSRIIPGCHRLPLHVSVPSDHPLREWAGKELHRWMDSCGEEVHPRPEDEARQMPEIDLFDFPEFPQERQIELISITTEDPHFRAWMAEGKRTEWPNLDPQNPEHVEKAKQLYMRAHMEVAKDNAKHARLLQAKQALDSLLGRIAYIEVKMSSSQQVDSRLIGSAKKALNKRIATFFGRARDAMTVEELERAYAWGASILKKLRESSKQ